MANIPEQTVLVDGLRIHCRRAGEGPLLVLLHGWPQTGYCWRHLIGRLSEGYTVVAPDLPELLAGADPAAYLGYFFERWTHNRVGLDEAAVAEYVRAFSAPGALRAGFDDYRASFPQDAEHDDADAAAGHKLTMHVLVLWGAGGLFGRLPALEVWQAYAGKVSGAAIPDCGHFLPEEQPELVLGELDGFLPHLSPR